MRVTVLKRGERMVEVKDFDQLVVETENGSRVAVVARYGPDGVYIVSSIDDDPRFHEVLKQLGLSQTTLVTDVKSLLLPDSMLPKLG
jgi:hypothetical protein